MSANTNPIFVGTPNNWFIATGTTANTALDGTGNVVTVATAGVNGAKIYKVRIWHMGTNVASVVRLFVNNGSSQSVASNNGLVYEYTMAANTLSQTAASVPAELLLDLVLAPGYKLNASIGTAVATGYMVSAEGGSY